MNSVLENLIQLLWLLSIGDCYSRAAFSWSLMVWANNVVFRALADSLNLSICIHEESNEIYAPLTFAVVLYLIPPSE